MNKYIQRKEVLKDFNKNLEPWILGGESASKTRSPEGEK